MVDNELEETAPKRVPPMMVTVNGKRKRLSNSTVTARDIVEQCLNRKTDRRDPDYTVTYKNGPTDKPVGTLSAKGTIVAVRDMVFKVELAPDKKPAAKKDESKADSKKDDDDNKK